MTLELTVQNLFVSTYFAHFSVSLIFLSIVLASEPQTPARNIDYNFAREELMLNELSNDSIRAAISRLERQHEVETNKVSNNFPFPHPITSL